MLLLDDKSVHFIGIGGVGMSALAKVLQEAGHEVSGSDLNESQFTAALRQGGATISIGHRAENIGNASLIVASSAVGSDNPEMREAQARGLRIIKRAELLGLLTRRFQSITVAGTHGKTTTSSMLSFLLEDIGCDPTILVGGEVANLGTNAKLGKGDYLVAEADEFDGSFLRLSPWTAIITNVEADHLDFYPDLDAIRAAFASFMATVPADGHLIVCADDPEALSLARKVKARVISYGTDASADWRASEIAANALGGSDFNVAANGQPIGRFTLRLPGQHNVQNALAAIAAIATLGIDPLSLVEPLRQFRGARRRFEHKDTIAGIQIFDDYAHHPTEIRSTLRAAREHHNGRVVCAFQPHTYNRTRQLWNDFLTAFNDADILIMSEIYLPAGREADTMGVSSLALVEALSHPNARYIPDLDAVTQYLCNILRPGDLLITMGAGNIYQVADAVVTYLRAEKEDISNE